MATARNAHSAAVMAPRTATFEATYETSDSPRPCSRRRMSRSYTTSRMAFDVPIQVAPTTMSQIRIVASEALAVDITFCG